MCQVVTCDTPPHVLVNNGMVSALRGVKDGIPLPLRSRRDEGSPIHSQLAAHTRTSQEEYVVTGSESCEGRRIFKVVARIEAP